jgi:2-oxoglutarate dehydrogenase E1 component
MSPKSLLRHPAAVSSLEEVAGGRFRKVIADDEAIPKSDVRRIALCSGKLYYELHDERQALALDDVALLRLEQYYPIPRAELAAALSAYEPETPVVWVQEEPMNMGAWPFLRLHFGDRIEGNGWHPLSGLCRPASASPATGSAASHKQEQRRLIERAFD